jgi:hypothetical protein
LNNRLNSGSAVCVKWTELTAAIVVVTVFEVVNLIRKIALRERIHVSIGGRRTERQPILVGRAMIETEALVA